MPGCASYLSSKPISKRESVEDRRLHLENQHWSSALTNSLGTHKEFMNKISFHSLAELKNKISDCKMNSDWIVLRKNDVISIVLLQQMPYPKVACYAVIDSNLIASLFVNDIQIKQVGNIQLPKKVGNVNELSDILDHAYMKFSSVHEDTINESIVLINDILEMLSTKLPERTDSIKFLKEQIALLNIHKSRLVYAWDTVVLWSLVHSISPHAYKYLRSSAICIMPHPNTLARLVSKCATNPSLEQNSEHFLSYLAKKVDMLDDDDKNVILLMDEIHLKTQLDYKGGDIVGHAYNSTECASSAYVFMVRSLDTPYKDVAHILVFKRIEACSS